MKIIRLFSVFLVGAMLFSGCKLGDGPSSASKKFMEKFIVGEFDAASRYATAQMQEKLEIYAELTGEEDFSIKKEQEESIKGLSCNTDGDEAVCSFKQYGYTIELHLVKIEDKWLVDKKADSPEAAAHIFMKHLNNANYGRAAIYGTDATVGMMSMFQALKSLGGESFEAMEDEDQEMEIKNLECEVNGQQAVCRFEDQFGELSELQMEQQNGKWLVDMKKENPYGDLDWDEEGEMEEEEWVMD